MNFKIVIVDKESMKYIILVNLYTKCMFWVHFFPEKVANFRKEIQEEETLSKNIKSKKKWTTRLSQILSTPINIVKPPLKIWTSSMITPEEYRVCMPAICDIFLIFFFFRFLGEISLLLIQRVIQWQMLTVITEFIAL